ncbi:MAG: hypothetical protein HN712_00125 [Gemmatimonadetes bacterium]|nr:hypothetical protein [Gemmatimonadota bacterium]MBT7858673.1 hypothetical protein [Gemmatimonadota bacterium]
MTLNDQGVESLSWRGFWVGIFLSFFLAIGAPFGNMIIRGSYMSLDFSTPGAIFLFLLLIGVLNALFKWGARGMGRALGLASVTTLGIVYGGWPVTAVDLGSPAIFLGLFLLASAWMNVAATIRGTSLALNRSELVLVYAMLLIVSALCTMGLSEQILPIITAIFYFASPQNHWAERLFPHLPSRLLVDDGTGSRLFYEGVAAGSGDQIPYASWVEPLCWWAIFLLALYMTMVSIAVIVRRQWMERERLAYPIAQVGLAMIRGERPDQLINGFFRRPSMWIGLCLPMLAGSLKALHAYSPGVPVVPLQWIIPFVGRQTLQLTVSFAMLGFSYFINANIAAGIWVFHLLSKVEKEVFILTGVKSTQKLGFGVADYPYLGYQGVGALLAMVLVGLWIGREHYRGVFAKAFGRAPHINDADEILSYRAAVAGLLGGITVMSSWLWFMGTPLWIAVLFIITALLIFIGITRIVAEAGLAAVRSPMIASDLVVQGLGSALVGPTGVLNLSLAYIWSSDIRIFVMATCTNALKMIEEMEPKARRVVFWAMVLALVIGAVGSLWMVFHMSYRHGGINLNKWFFQSLPAFVYNAALRNIEPAATYWSGLGFMGGGAVVMGLMMFLRQRLPWWPIHPIGFPLGANSMMNFVWFNVFLAWFLKRLILRYGGAANYRRSQSFFLGLIAGQVLCNGLWLVIDYITGKINNGIFWV